MCTALALAHPTLGAVIATDTRHSAYLPDGSVLRRDWGGKLARAGNGWVTATGDGYFAEAATAALAMVDLEDLAAVTLTLRSVRAAFDHEIPPASTIVRIATDTGLGGSFTADSKCTSWGRPHAGASGPKSSPLQDWRAHAMQVSNHALKAQSVPEMLRRIAEAFVWASGYDESSDTIELGVGARYARVRATTLRSASDAEIEALFRPPPARKSPQWKSDPGYVRRMQEIGHVPVALHHAAHDADGAPLLIDFVDIEVAGETASYTLPASVVQGDMFFSVGATPYPAFSAGSVSGTPGEQVVRTIPIVSGPAVFVTLEFFHASVKFYLRRFCDSVWVYEMDVLDNAGLGEPDITGQTPTVLATETEYSVTYPAAGFVRFVYFEPRSADVSIAGEGAYFAVGATAILPSFTTPTHDETTTPGTGIYGITVKDPAGIATDLYYRTKSGAAAWSAWTLKTSSPADETAYTESVTLVEGHQSYVEFRLDYTFDGTSLSVFSQSAGMDFGYAATIVSVLPEWIGDRLWVTVAADSDTRTSGQCIIGDAGLSFPNTGPTIADHDFSIDDARAGRVDTGFDMSNPGEGQTIPVAVRCRAIDATGALGETFIVVTRRIGTATPAGTIDSFTQTKVQGGTACTTDPAQSSVAYTVTAAGTDTVTIERHVDGVNEATILSASTTHSDTLTDDHEFYEDGVSFTPLHNVRYHLLLKTSGGTVITDAWTDEVQFTGVVDC